MASDDSPRGSNLPLWLVGLVAVAGAALFGLPRGSEQPQLATPPAVSPKEEKPAEPPADEGDFSPLHILRDYLRVTASEPGRSWYELQLREGAAKGSVAATVEKKRDREKPPSLASVLLSEPAEYEFLIATVPDPVESKFAHEFDAALAGIQRAFEARSFILRASRLPWPRDHGRAGGGGDAPAGPPHREYPGVLLFRKSHKARTVDTTFAVVCLVGESPISGIHQPALRQALLAWDELNDAIRDVARGGGAREKKVAWAEDGADTLRIVAPYFTGSQASLLLTLRERTKERRKQNKGQNGDGPSVAIINGSATALNPVNFTGKAGSPPDFIRFPAPSSTVIPNALLTQGVFRYLAGDPGPSLDASVPGLRDRVAILRETNTGFGAQVALQSAPDSTREKTRDRYVEGHIIDLPFPMSISQLQVDVERTAKRGPVLPHTEFVEPRFPVRDLTQLDAIPPYDPESAAAFAGQGLRAICTTIQRARVRYVGIVATDSRDVVFLTRLLRQECPNVRVFSTEPSVALLHPEDAQYMRGMVVASTYPLVPVTQYWARTERSPHQMIPFPTQGSQGYYNAVLAHFRCPELMLGYHPPRIPGAEGSRFDRPPIWISVVGQGGRFVPVHCYTEYGIDATEETNYKDKLNIYSALWPETWPAEGDQTSKVRMAETGGLPANKPAIGVPIGILLCSLAAAGALGAVILALTVAPSFWQAGAAGLSQEEAEVLQSGRSAGDEDWGFCITIWGWRALMLAGLLLFALPYVLPATEIFDRCCGLPVESQENLGQFLHANWPQLAIFSLGMVLFAETIGVLAALVWRARGQVHPGEDRRGYLALAIVLVLGVAAAVACAPKTPAARFFLYVRATDLTAGLSPLVPMGLFGVTLTVLGFCGLKQADLVRRVQLRCPYPDADPFKEIRRADDRLQRSFKTPLGFLLPTDADASRAKAGGGPAPSRFRAYVSSPGIAKALGLALALEGALLAYALWDAFVTSLHSGEGANWDGMMQVILSVIAALVVLTLVRFLVLWSQLAELLAEILHVPMVGAFERLPDEVRRLFGGYLYAMEQFRRSHLAVLYRLQPRPDREGSPVPSGRDFSAQAERYGDKAEGYLKELFPSWGEKSVEEAFGTTQPKGEKAAEAKAEVWPCLTEAAPDADQKERFVAAYVVLYLGQYFAQLRQVVWALVAVPPLLVVAVASYAFQPDRPQLTSLMVLLVIVAGGIVYVLYRINRDGLVSRISRTTPNRFTPDLGFFSSLTTFVLPIVTVVLLQVLGVFRFIMDPILALFE
jgi:hypothetical protein